MAIVVRDTTPISMTDIQDVFGGNLSLQSYYRGGVNVANVAGTAAIPTTGAISMFDFLNTYEFTITQPSPSSILATDPDDVGCGITFLEDGTFSISRTNQSTVFGTWSPDATVPPQLEARWVKVSGVDPDNGTLNVWQDMNFLVYGLSLVSASQQSKNSTADLEIRARGNVSPIVTWRFFFDVETVGGGGVGVGGGPPL